jgi:hypothetical protein
MPIQDIPIRMPDNYDGFKSFFPRFVRDFVVPADVRNANGAGLTVSSDGNSVATLTTQVTQTVLDNAIATHEAAANPHPTYLTQAEGDALYAPLATFTALIARFRHGTGTPEGNVTAEVGSMFLRSDGSNANEVVYIKTSGSSNTGWTAMSVP